jgi:hypothetical protein
LSRQRRGRLTAAAARLARILGTDDCLLIGGLALGVHGYVRATDDLDFITRQPLSATRVRLRDLGIATRLLRGDALDGGFDCLKGEIDGIPFDVLPPLVPVDWDASIEVIVGGETLKVVDLDGLLQLKFRAGGAQDLLDVVRLVLTHPAAAVRARELATAYGARDRFETWLENPRTRQQAREEAERAGRRSRRTGTWKPRVRR